MATAQEHYQELSYWVSFAGTNLTGYLKVVPGFHLHIIRNLGHDSPFQIWGGFNKYETYYGVGTHVGIGLL